MRTSRAERGLWVAIGRGIAIVVMVGKAMGSYTNPYTPDEIQADTARAQWQTVE